MMMNDDDLKLISDYEKHSDQDLYHYCFDFSGMPTNVDIPDRTFLTHLINRSLCLSSNTYSQLLYFCRQYNISLSGAIESILFFAFNGPIEFIPYKVTADELQEKLKYSPYIGSPNMFDYLEEDK